MSTLEGTKQQAKTIYPILGLVSAAHLLNDSLQAVITASYPVLQEALTLSFTQLGFITFVLYFSSSVMQPFVGAIADARPTPFILPAGMLMAMLGMFGLGLAPAYWAVLAAVLLVGVASAMFHPEGARIAYMAAGPRRGLAQSIFQVGGNMGSALAPIMTAYIFYPFGQKGAYWFIALAAAGFMIQMFVARWYSSQLRLMPPPAPKTIKKQGDASQDKAVRKSILYVIVLVFARSWFSASIGTYFVFFLMEKYGLSIPNAQMYIFTYMAAGIIGTFFGGPLSDKYGRRNVILLSLLGAVPFAIALPFSGLIAAYPLLFLLGLINHSSFSVTVVYVQEMVPGKVGMVSGLITGLAFGMGALGSMVLGIVIDLTSVTTVIIACSFMPLLGLIGFLLPPDKLKGNKAASV
ncbi:MFS transporter [Paenibacillus sp. JCM 10914]|uniref:MFS transporter n=1 Tax=Paenibacillus sp. JCM 10914 TaxID=1236974 RepID=UPI0003CC83B4|nr:MFS transporter [Paenibacillus sp. JCM 10914]GAE07153.1 fosmidomycin resistance protein [Paenibacillus sp. JCM 10914]